MLNLEPISIPESSELLGALGMLSHYDIYKLLSIVGGVPWYLEQFNPGAYDNIKQLPFEKTAYSERNSIAFFMTLFHGKARHVRKP